MHRSLRGQIHGLRLGCVLQWKSRKQKGFEAVRQALTISSGVKLVKRMMGGWMKGSMVRGIGRWRETWQKETDLLQQSFAVSEGFKMFQKLVVMRLQKILRELIKGAVTRYIGCWKESKDIAGMDALVGAEDLKMVHKMMALKLKSIMNRLVNGAMVDCIRSWRATKHVDIDFRLGVAERVSALRVMKEVVGGWTKGSMVRGIGRWRETWQKETDSLRQSSLSALRVMKGVVGGWKKGSMVRGIGRWRETWQKETDLLRQSFAVSEGFKMIQKLVVMRLQKILRELIKGAVVRYIGCWKESKDIAGMDVLVGVEDLKMVHKMMALKLKSIMHGLVKGAMVDCIRSWRAAKHVDIDFRLGAAERVSGLRVMKGVVGGWRKGSMVRGIGRWREALKIDTLAMSLGVKFANKVMSRVLQGGMVIGVISRCFNCWREGRMNAVHILAMDLVKQTSGLQMVKKIMAGWVKAGLQRAIACWREERQKAIDFAEIEARKAEGAALEELQNDELLKKIRKLGKSKFQAVQV